MLPGIAALPHAPTARPRRRPYLVAAAAFALLLLAWLGAWGCARPWQPMAVPVTPVKHDRAERETRAVVLVAVDGVRWQEIFAGVDPHLAGRANLDASEVVPADRLLPHIYERLVRRGVALGGPGHGHAVTVAGPHNISLPGYQEMLSGQTDERCSTNECAFIDRPTLLDEVRAVSKRDEDVALIASWETLERAAAVWPERVVVSAGRHAGKTRDKLRLDARCAALLDEGERADAWPGHSDYRPDAVTARLALAYLEAARPRLLFVGLGDTDEMAHRSDYAGYLAALRHADAFVGALFAALDRMGDDGAATTVLLTTDHGRAWNFHAHGRRSPESARVFVLAAGGAVPALGHVEATRGRSLLSIAPTVRGLLGLGAADGALDEPWRQARLDPPWSPTDPTTRLAQQR